MRWQTHRFFSREWKIIIVGPKEEFLTTLKMMLTIAPASVEELKRAEELTVRTHQLNTTGYTYSYEELDQFRQSDRHLLLIAGLDDKYGTYGKIGVILVECFEAVWTIKLLLMSCRVMSRGVGSVVINHIRNEARINITSNSFIPQQQRLLSKSRFFIP